LAFVVLPGLARADEVRLKGAGKVTGQIVERTETAVVVETGPGRVTIARARIERIVESRSAIEVYGARALVLRPTDAEGWTGLARFAAENGLSAQSRQAWSRVLAVEPDNPEANAALGRAQIEGRWMSEDEAYRTHGYVPFEGRWVSPDEHDALLRERAADEAAERERREAELRLREAEARAREAEANARAAEAAAAGTAPDGGIPYWVAGGVSVGAPFWPCPWVPGGATVLTRHRPCPPEVHAGLRPAHQTRSTGRGQRNAPSGHRPTSIGPRHSVRNASVAEPTRRASALRP
jgi:hypothetical protein